MGWDKSDFIVAGMCPVYPNIKELDAFLGPGSGHPKPQISLYWFLSICGVLRDSTGKTSWGYSGAVTVAMTQNGCGHVKLNLF